MNVPFTLTQFDEENFRFYSKSADDFQDGDKYVSVTTALDCIIHKELKNWMTNNSKTLIGKTLKVSGDFGSLMHQYVEDDLKGNLKMDKVSMEMMPFLNKWFELKEKHRIEALYVEIPVYHPTLGYAGRIDSIAKYYNPDTGKTTIKVLDLKTGRFSITTGWQLAAYKAAAEKCLGIEIEGMAGIHLPRDGSEPKAFVYQHIAPCFMAFLCALNDWKMLYYNWLAGSVKQRRAPWKYLTVNPLCINPEYL